MKQQDNCVRLSRLVGVILLAVLCVELAFAAQYVPSQSMTKNQLIYYLSNPRYATGYDYDAKDSANNYMQCVSVIDLVGQAHKYAAVYHTPYAAGAGYRYKINLATSNDLINWTYRYTLVDNADMPKIVKANNGAWLVLIHEQWMNSGPGGYSQDPSRIGFKLFYNDSDLWNGTIRDTWLAPQYSGYGLDGTPNFYDCHLEYVGGWWCIGGQIGFHFWDGYRDSNAVATIGEIFSPAGTDWWAASTASGYNNNLISQGVTGNIGQRENLVVSSGRYNIQEGNIGTPAGSWDKWRIWLYDYSEGTAYPTGAGTFTQLAPQTHGGSTSFGNPAVSIVDKPGGGKRMFVSYFIFSQGAAAGEAGSLIYYFDL